MVLNISSPMIISYDASTPLVPRVERVHKTPDTLPKKEPEYEESGSSKGDQKKNDNIPFASVDEANKVTLEMAAAFFNSDVLFRLNKEKDDIVVKTLDDPEPCFRKAVNEIKRCTFAMQTLFDDDKDSSFGPNLDRPTIAGMLKGWKETFLAQPDKAGVFKKPAYVPEAAMKQKNVINVIMQELNRCLELEKVIAREPGSQRA